ncbi:MAG TPA: 5-methyltetrahydropteroyltriglutamate--homocysteine S-methyltransferase, partial [Candidatus Sumerlaeota bacterium]|nr:5-methyltetrahydropteroyltriglutamate--homocysteine S-methyltransferase [Candidatus Sumerlaeota bacterium]
MQTHVLGFPRIGVQRELKKALESYWNGATSPQDLDAVCDQLKRRHWQIQKDAGLSFVATGDFSLYDQMLDVTFMLGAVPDRFRENAPACARTLYFQMARGDVERNRAAMAMTKWFNTNYHYLVPEFSPSLKLSLFSKTIVEDTRLAAALGFSPKPTLVGPITYLSLARDLDGANRWDRLDEITALYAEVLAELAPLCEWIQLEEPILCADLSAEARRGFPTAYETLNRAAGPARLLLATYFERLDENLDLAIDSGCAGLHLDLVRGRASLESVPERLPDDMTLSAGLVDGRNIWKTDLNRALDTLRPLAERLGPDRLMVGSSCSLLHSPVDLECEPRLDPEVKQWMAFATQKCREVALLGETLEGQDRHAELQANAEAMESRRCCARTDCAEVRNRCAAVTEDQL